MRAIFLVSAVVVLSACAASKEVGALPGSRSFGDAVQTNDMAQQIAFQRGQYLIDANARFAAETTETVSFPFNSVELTPVTRSALNEQAAWLQANPDIRMSVTGHTDLVGGEAYNTRLGFRRAQAVARYLLAQGIAQGRVEAVESRGETEPVVDSEKPEAKNRRAVTTVAGFTHGFVGDSSDGRRAALVYERYATDAVEEPEQADSTGGGG